MDTILPSKSGKRRLLQIVEQPVPGEYLIWIAPRQKLVQKLFLNGHAMVLSTFHHHSLTHKNSDSPRLDYRAAHTGGSQSAVIGPGLQSVSRITLAPPAPPALI